MSVKHQPAPLHPDTRDFEDDFRQQVRDILGLDWSTRDQTLFDELRRLKRNELQHEQYLNQHVHPSQR